MRFLQAPFNPSFGGFGFPGILAVSLGEVALFAVIVIGRSRDFFRFIPGLPGEGGSG